MWANQYPLDSEVTIPAPWTLPLAVRQRILTELHTDAARVDHFDRVDWMGRPRSLPKALVHRASFRKGSSVSKWLGRG